MDSKTAKLVNFSLNDKVALVTGASHGIGKTASLEMARVGADIVLASRKLPDLEKVAAEIKSMGRKALPVAAHIGRLEEINNLVSKAKEHFGRIDILVNNAGVNPTWDSSLEIGERAWDSVMNLNLKGLFFLSQAVARLMKEQGGGKIINVSSITGISPDLFPAYSISKAGVIMATKVMAKDWAKYNIMVNCIAPGNTRTRMFEPILTNEKIIEGILSEIPLGRIAEPVEMAGAIIYLASDAASYVTGQILAVDGGVTI